mgnify:CR=1 FL=1
MLDYDYSTSYTKGETRMKWTKIHAEYFMAFPSFTLELEDRGLVLIQGKNLSSDKFESNGSGKTTLISAIVFALHGVTVGGLKGDEVVHRQTGKGTAVILEGVKGEDKYRIERYRKHSKHKNKVRVFLNDTEITEKSAKDTDKLIQQIIGMDYNTFVNSILFSQSGGAGRFSTASDAEKKALLENLSNLQVYTDAQTIAKEKVKQKDNEIEVKRREEEKIQWELSNVDSLEQQDKERYESTRVAIQQEEEKFENTKQAMNDHIQNNQHNVTGWINEVEKLKEQQDQLSSPTNPHTETVNELTSQLNELKGEQQKLNIQQNDLVTKYKKLGLQDTCPVCGNQLDTEHRDKEQASLVEQLRGILTQLNTINPEVERVQQQYNEAYTAYLEVKKQQDSIVTVHRDFSNKINHYNSLQQQYSNQLESYKSNLSAITSTLNRLKSFPEPTSRDEQRLAIKERINACKTAIVALQKERNILEDCVKIFSNAGVKSHVLDLITPFLNERANKYLGMLAGNDMEIKFSTQTPKKDGEMTEKFDVQLTNAVGGDSYKANSEGEKKRADLAIAQALQDLVVSRAASAFNIVLYDEVFDALDEIGAENTIAMLKEKQKDIGTILVITHNATLKNLFDKVITITKNPDGTSVLTEGAEIT